MASESPRRRRTKRSRNPWRRIIWWFVLVGLVVPAVGLAWGAYRLRTELHAMKSDYRHHQYTALSSDMHSINGTFAVMGVEAHLLGWLDVLPFIRGYYLNAMDLLSAGQQYLRVFGQAVPPVLAATESSANPMTKAAAVRAAVSHAGQLVSQLQPELASANRSIQNMNAHRMPSYLAARGLGVASLKFLSQTLYQLTPAMTGPRPILARLLGLPNPTRYLLIFQNSGELRATGGFMTAYAYVPFKDGKLGKIFSQNIQTLDQAVTYRPAPPTIITYLPVSYWHLRDANTAIAGLGTAVPDVPEAASNFYQFYHSIPGAKPVNGIVFIDTWLVDDLIGDVGGLNVPTLRGKTVHLTAQNANYEMEYMAEGLALPANLRKLFIGTMMRELMHDVFHGHTSELLRVAGTLAQGLAHEHIMLYFNSLRAERFAAGNGWGGVIPSRVPGDFVEVIDENLLGHKDNYWMHESYDVNITTTKTGQNLETVTIHWVEPAISVPKPPYLVVPYHTWVTVFAPAGSTYVSMTGTASGGNGSGGGIDSYVQQTFDPTVNKDEFGAHMNLPARTSASQPPAQGTVVTQFYLPKGVPINRILLQKQPGLKREPVTVTVNGHTKQITLNADTWVTF